jgi:hypothetical protein
MHCLRQLADLVADRAQHKRMSVGEMLEDAL